LQKPCKKCGGVERLSGECIVCKKEYKRQWYLANSEKIKEISRRYYEANREKKRDISRRYYAANTERRIKYEREYRELKNGSLIKRLPTAQTTGQTTNALENKRHEQTKL
jgi:hypothetical protein